MVRTGRFGVRPALKRSTTIRSPTISLRARRPAVVWRDNRGGGGTIDHNAYWNPSDSYYQPWLPEGECTFYGTRLLDRSYVDASGQTVVPPYDWGYADNAGKSDYDGQFCLFPPEATPAPSTAGQPT
ncbi:hypothetical protein [Alistipes putredinis]|uniref:hypothetical protein n=1 Tax=Alistipes putredinis TaxID=28117 RepID=UPI00399188C3